MSEYDAQSRAASQEYLDNYDRIFRKSKEERRERSERRQLSEEDAALELVKATT